MKHSTFSAQVATNLLNVLQGYTKGIRFVAILTMLLTVGIGSAWGATDVSLWSDSNPSYQASATEKTSTDGAIKWKNSAGNNYSNPTRLYSGNTLTISVADTTTTKITKIVAVCTSEDYATAFGGTSVVVTGGGTANRSVSSSTTTITITGEATSVAMKMSAQSRVSKLTVTYETAAAHTVTWTINPIAGGTLSATSGNTTTVSPNAAYTYGAPAYTVTSGAATVSQSGNTFTATPTANSTIQINMVEKPKYTVTWNVNGEVYETTQVTKGSKPTFPATPSSCDATSNTFYGWATATWDGKINDVSAKTIYTSANNMPAEAATYYAVFFERGGGSVLINESFDDKSSSDSNQALSSSTFPNFNGTTEKAYKSKYGGVQFGSSSAVGYITSKSLDLSTAFTVTLDACKYGSDASNIDVTVGTQTKTISNSSLEEAGSFKTFTLEFEPATSTSTVKIGTSSKRAYIDNVIIATGGGASNFITTCAAGDPCASLQAPNVTATPTANSITLSWDAVDGAISYNVYNYTTHAAEVVNVLTYTFNGLAPETEYSWEVEAVSATCNGKGTQGTTTTLAEAPTSYTITFETNGGTNIDKITNATALPNPLPTPTREHYTFAGWFTDEGCTQAATAGATIDADIILYAKWEATMYTVTLNPNYPNGKTGVFTDKEGNIIPGNIEVSLQSGTASQALKNFYSSIELDNYAFDGFYTQANGGSKRVNTGDITGNITFFAHWKEKYTITWNVNGDTELISPTTFAEGDAWDMPTTDYDCSGKEFVGWTTNPIIAAQDEAPDPLYTNASQFPNATTTYYAVFAENTDGGGSGGYEKLTAALDDYSGEYLIVYEDGSVAFNGGLAILDATSNYISVTITEGVIASNATTDAAKFTFAKVDGGYSILSTSGKYIGREASSNGLNTNSTYAAGYLNTITYNSITGKGECTLKYNDASDQKRFRYFASGQKAIALYKKSGSSATYTAYSTSCIPTYSITYDFAGGIGSHCSNTSVPQGDQYIICDEEPTKEGYTFLHWSDGVNTYNPSDVIKNVTADITLTAVWQINTYTVTWSNNGTPTPVVYNHGDALEVPNAPASCDGVKEFVGWTEQSSYYHATTAPTDLFKTTTATVTADKTYYAVFATRGEGSANFVLGESGTFKMYANVNGTNYYAQGGVSSSKITSTTEAANASDYTLTYADGSYTIKQGTSTIGHISNTDLSTTASTWTISAGTNGSWRIKSDNDNSRALSYSSSAKAFKAYATSNITEGNETYFDIEFGSGSSGYSDYTTTCQQVESIEVQDNPKTEFNLTDDFTIGTGKVIATLSGGGTTDVTALATFSGYNMNVVGTYTVTVTYMGATATYEITVNPLDNAWVLTWNVSGKTNTGLGPRSVTKNSAIGTLPTPEVPAACAGKTFMGWTTSNIVNSDGTGITYITPETVPTDNTTYYAVFATINNFCSQKPIDQITNGSKVVIVAVASLTDNGGAGKAISSRATDDTHNLQGDDVAIYDQTINTPHSTCIWTITKSGEKYIFTQDGKYLNGIIDGKYSNLKYDGTSDEWTLTSAASGMARTYNMESTNASGEYIEWYNEKFTIHNDVNNNGAFDMQFFVTANAAGNADTTDYTTGCAEYTITYYGFRGGYSTSCSSDGTIVLPVNSIHTIPNCEGLVINDHNTNLNRTFTGVWMTKPHGGHTFKPGDTFILTQDTTLYAQWKMETTSDVTTLPTDIEDLAGTDIYVYGGKTLTLQPGTTTINSLTLKGGIQKDGSYKMPTVWVPEGATLIRKSNKIYLDLVVNAQTYYPFAVPFAAKNNANVEYLDPGLAAASTYGTHFVIKTYDGANRAQVGEDKANNWVKVLRDETLQPGVGYIITALTRPTKDTATIRIPMTVPDTWFNNGEQAAVGTTVRNTIAVTAHAGAAATKHQRHAGWNFVANPYLTNFTGGNVANDGDLAYINGELIIEGSYEYGGDPVPYVTIPAYNFASYSQHKLSDVKLSPEYSFFVQVVHGGTMNFTTAGRQQAPASIAARNAEERPVKMDVDLILSDNHSSDQTGIIICDRYTDAYEIGHDLEKLFGSAYNLSVYTLMADNTPLAFQALAIRSSMQVIPVGYRAPEQGEYTFRLNEATSSIDLLNEQYEQLVLVDYHTGELTNLLYTDYTFYSERTQSNARFAIYAVPRQNAPTDLPNAIGQDKQAQKILHNGHLYILRDGNIYNGNGQIVK